MASLDLALHDDEHLGVRGPSLLVFRRSFGGYRLMKPWLVVPMFGRAAAHWPAVSHFKFSGSGWTLGASSMYCSSPPSAILFLHWPGSESTLVLLSGIGGTSTVTCDARGQHQRGLI